jgi:predicted transcriptional regulator
MIVRVVLSTAPMERVTIFDILLANNGILTTNQVTEFLNVSKPTALRTMTELKALGLVDMEEQFEDGNRRNVMVISLKEQFNWFLSEEFKTLREGFKPDEGEADESGSTTANDDSNIASDARKEKYPPPITANNALTGTDNEKEKNNTSVYGGEISLRAPNDNSSADNLEEWWQNERKKVTPLDLSYYAFSGYRCYYCSFETDGKGSKSCYEDHVKSKHGDDLDHPCYPTKGDIERLVLKAQGKSWEI